MAVANEVSACCQRCLHLCPTGQPAARDPGQANRLLMQTRTVWAHDCLCLLLLRFCHSSAACGSQIGFAQH